MIQVTRSLHIEWPRCDQAAVVSSASYASLSTDTLLEAVSLAGDTFLRRSEDNGQTWERCEDWAGTESLDERRYVERYLPGLYLDPDNGRLFRLYMENESDRRVMIAWGTESRTRKLYLQYSHDEGRSWSPPEQLLVHGDEFDESHWAPGIWAGENSGVAYPVHAFKLPDGTILMPFGMDRRPQDGCIGYKGRFTDWIYCDPELGSIERQCACLLGHWRPDGSGLDWDIGEYVSTPASHSADGTDEPCVAPLPDGRLFMLMRTRTFPDSAVEVPSAKHYAVSEDGGRTWSETMVLRYDDRGCVYSPACFGVVLQSEKNGRLYLISNLADRPSYNCDPRTRLQIAEIDTDTLRVIRESVTIIQEREPGDQESIRFSNFAYYQDRRTGNIVLLMTPAPGPVNYVDTPRALDVPVPPNSYRYDIALPL